MIFIRGLVLSIQGTTAVLMLIAVTLNFSNIVGRYALRHPVASAEELMLFLMVGTVFFGNAVVGFEGKQLRMDVILRMLPERLRLALDVAADLAMIGVCVTLIVLGWPAVEMLAAFDQRSEAADIPMFIPQAMVPIGLGLNAFFVAVRFVISLRKPRPC
jgi:TRAP-type C4-dicarboxylate transport system permease small subunit